MKSYFLIVFISVVQSCGFQSNENQVSRQSSPKMTGVQGSDASITSYADVKAKILEPNNCISCHVYYDNYYTVKENLATILGRINKDEMPLPKRKNQPVTFVDSELRKSLLQWARNGAPEFSDGTSSPAPRPGIDTTWQSLRNNVIGPKCIVCHNSYGSLAPRDFSTFDALKTALTENPSLFNFSDPVDSHFIGSILGRVDDDEFFFDPMPFQKIEDLGLQRKVPEISEDELFLLKEWIGLKLPYSRDVQGNLCGSIQDPTTNC